MASRLKTILSWYEGADSRCRHEIFGDIFGLALGVGTRDNFPAHDAEQAFLFSINTPDPEFPVVATSLSAPRASWHLMLSYLARWTLDFASTVFA